MVIPEKDWAIQSCREYLSSPKFMSTRNPQIQPFWYNMQMRSSSDEVITVLGWVPHPIKLVSLYEGGFLQHRRRSNEDWCRDWTDESVCQGKPRLSSNEQKLKEILPCGEALKVMALPTPWLTTSTFKIKEHQFRPLGLGCILQTPWDANAFPWFAW